MRERLDKIISQNSVFSRSEAKKLIRMRAVTVNGITSLDPGAPVGEDTAVSVNGKLLNIRFREYLMLNKRAGAITASRDLDCETVMDLLPEEYRRKRLFAVGRLDKDAEGLLLVTDDGELAHRLISPRRAVEKTYFVRLAEPQKDFYAARFMDGVRLKDGGVCKSAVWEPSQDDGGRSGRLTIVEGKYHQVKRMFGALGNRVTYLRRISIGGVALDDSLAPGEARPLTDYELSRLRRAAGLRE